MYENTFTKALGNAYAKFKLEHLEDEYENDELNEEEFLLEEKISLPFHHKGSLIDGRYVGLELNRVPVVVFRLNPLLPFWEVIQSRDNYLLHSLSDPSPIIGNPCQ